MPYPAPKVGFIGKWAPKVYRFTGTRVHRQKTPKSLFHQEAEAQFLAERKTIPPGFVNGFTSDDVSGLKPEFSKLLSLSMASNKDVSKFRKSELIDKFKQSTYDTNSLPVKIAVLTESILNMRQHILTYPRDSSSRQAVAITIGKRTRAMRQLYKVNTPLYEWVCSELGIKCIRFSVPGIKHPSKAINPLAIDGDRVKWLIRRKLWKARNRPRPEESTDGKARQVYHLRHRTEAPPDHHGKPRPVQQQVSKEYPYGVGEDRVRGEYTVHNPTAPGAGHVTEGY
jgi:small subunit ribosomal protein S15